MVCEKCRYVNKDTAEVCKHCGAPFKETPQKVTAASGYEPRAVNTAHIKTAPRAVKVEPAKRGYDFSGNETPKSVKTVSFSKPQPAAVTREYNTEAEESEEFEADAAEQDRRRDNIKFIAIVASLIVFVIGAIIVFVLLLFGKPGAAPSGASALPSVTPAATAEPSPVSVPTTADLPTT
jgi:cobalamin biosynthesis Mg chelatase CobN